MFLIWKKKKEVFKERRMKYILMENRRWIQENKEGNWCHFDREHSSIIHFWYEISLGCIRGYSSSNW